MICQGKARQGLCSNATWLQILSIEDTWFNSHMELICSNGLCILFSCLSSFTMPGCVSLGLCRVLYPTEPHWILLSEMHWFLSDCTLVSREVWLILSHTGCGRPHLDPRPLFRPCFSVLCQAPHSTVTWHLPLTLGLTLASVLFCFRELKISRGKLQDSAVQADDDSLLCSPVAQRSSCPLYIKLLLFERRYCSGKALWRALFVAPVLHN